MKTTILCTGDSVTEGMATDGHHEAEYGKSPYPARLYTILTDLGYEVEVYNYGHGGERMPEIAARLGGATCYLAEDVVIPEDNTPVSLGKNTPVDGRSTGTKLKLRYADGAGEDYCVYFTQMSHDTNPVTIGGQTYEMSVCDETNYIRKCNPDGRATVIPAGSAVLTANRRRADLSILYGGINDQRSLTLGRWLDLMESCGSMNGGRYIVLGSTHALWEKWCDVTDDTPEARYAHYLHAADRRFGTRFIDLYAEFAHRGLDIALGGGYFRDKSERELAVMREKLARHVIPAEFTYNKKEDGNVHLSEEGYHVIGTLIAERAILLGYVRK